MKNEIPFETKAHSMTGKGSIDFLGKDDLNTFATKLIPNFNPDRFDALGLRFYAYKDLPLITFYAVDKFKQEQENYPKDKIPVKKFKLKMSFCDFLQHLKSFNLTLTNGNYDMEDILVMNK